MQTHRSATQTLNYFQQSPVRGRLEPSDGVSRTGWRYLQCTDTPNELRVLLPPRTALVYSYLLKAEVQELSKDKGAAWDRIIQIRHLKDRMIRKCQRIAKDSTSGDKNTGRVMMFTVHAPPDFRLKEMERWFRDQGPDFVQKMNGSTKATAQSGAYCCSKCGPPNSQPRKTLPAPADTAKAGRTVIRSNDAPTRAPAVTRSRSMSQTVPRARTPTDTKCGQPRSSSKPPARAPEGVPKRPSNSSEETAVEAQPQPQIHKRVKELIQQQLPTPPTLSRSNSAHSASPPRAPSVSPPPASPPPSVPIVIRVPDIPSIPPIPLDILTPEDSDEDDDEFDDLSLLSSIRGPVTRRSIQSPEPLPIPYRPREPISPPPEPADVPTTAVEARPESPENPRVSSPDSTLIEAGQNDGELENLQIEPPTTGQPLETIHERSEGSEISHGRPLVRRRSSLKKRDSMSKLSAASNSKSVTWAMDRDWTDQMSKFVKSTNEAEVAAYELGELRAHYQEEIAMMRIVCHDALIAAEHMGLNTDVLQREAVALAEQESKVIAVTDHMERKESHYREKVMNVLEETRRVVQLCDKKRDQQDQ